MRVHQNLNSFLSAGPAKTLTVPPDEPPSAGDTSTAQMAGRVGVRARGGPDAEGNAAEAAGDGNAFRLSWRHLDRDGVRAGVVRGDIGGVADRSLDKHLVHRDDAQVGQHGLADEAAAGGRAGVLDRLSQQHVHVVAGPDQAAGAEDRVPGARTRARNPRSPGRIMLGDSSVSPCS